MKPDASMVPSIGSAQVGPRYYLGISVIMLTKTEMTLHMFKEQGGLVISSPSTEQVSKAVGKGKSPGDCEGLFTKHNVYLSLAHEHQNETAFTAMAATQAPQVLSHISLTNPIRAVQSYDAFMSSS